MSCLFPSQRMFHDPLAPQGLNPTAPQPSAASLISMDPKEYIQGDVGCRFLFENPNSGRLRTFEAVLSLARLLLTHRLPCEMVDLVVTTIRNPLALFNPRDVNIKESGGRLRFHSGLMFDQCSSAKPTRRHLCIFIARPPPITSEVQRQA